VEQRIGQRGTESAQAESTIEVATSNLVTVARGRAGAEVAVLAGDRFMVVDALGDIQARSTHGLYAADTRFLSTYALQVNGQQLLPLSARSIDRDTARFYATNSPGSELDQGALSLVREQRIDGSLYDELLLTNHTPETLSVELTLTCAVDFLDLFEIRSLDGRHPPMECTQAWENDRLVFTCTQDGLGSHTVVAFSVVPERRGPTARFAFRLSAQESWRLGVKITPSADVREARPPVEHAKQLRTDEPIWHVPRLDTPDATLRMAYEQAIRDLRSLEMISEAGHRLLAAGLPWFVALFGRDMLLTAYETLLLGPDQSIGALEALAAFQSTQTDDFRDAEPGKMPHEVRTGRLARLGQVPHTRYYGTVDATILWLILLNETYRWTGDVTLVRRLWPAAQAALAWIETYADPDRDGFIEYTRRSQAGLDNQGWKDSWDAIRFADGQLAQGPIALVEVQGYVYDAKLRMAELFEVLGDEQRAKSLRKHAARLKKAFNAAFWLPEHGYYALALDRDKRPVDSITSNPGHALWSGIRIGATITPRSSRSSNADTRSWWARWLARRRTAFCVMRQRYCSRSAGESRSGWSWPKRWPAARPSSRCVTAACQRSSRRA
jgi:glycogen debranching enzyme